MSLGFMPANEKWREQRRVVETHFRPNAIAKYRAVQAELARDALLHILDEPRQFTRHLFR